MVTVRLPELVGYDEAAGRELYLADWDVVGSTAAPLRVPSPHYACLLAGDTTARSEADVHRVARAVLTGGAVVVAVWGRGCERAHRLVTDAVLMHETSQAEEHVVMTSWHAEPLDEALLYFLTETTPSAAYRDACHAGVAVVSAGAAERSRIRHALATPMEHVARMNAAAS